MQDDTQRSVLVAGATGGLQFNDDLATGIAYFHGVLSLP